MNGWPFLGATTLASLLAFAAVVSIEGTEEAGLRTLVRVTVRISFVYFLLVYSASSLRRLFPNAATRFLLRNRRQLGLSFFVAHMLHLDAIWLLSLLLGDAFQTDLVAVLFGGWVYLLATAMAITSTDRTAAWLGPRRWNALHKAGLHTLWITFVYQWVGKASENAAYVPVVVLTFVALGVRLAARRRQPKTGDAIATPGVRAAS